MRRTGFTLIELIVSLTIFAMILGSIFYVLGVELKYWKKFVACGEKQQIANMVLARIARDVRGASNIIPSSGSQVLLLSVGGETVEYSLVDKKVRRKKNASSSYLTDIGDIKTLSFLYPTSKSVEISLENITTSVGMRN